MKILATFCITIIIFATSCNNPKKKDPEMKITPPKAKKIAKNLEMNGDIRDDSYYWLNDRENSEVIDYLNAENDYFNNANAP